MIDYNDGKWHGWNGGECPVHPETEVQVCLADRAEESGDMIDIASNWTWMHNDDGCDLISFRVVEEHKEPREIQINEVQAVVSFDEGTAKWYYDNRGYGKPVKFREVIE